MTSPDKLKPCPFCKETMTVFGGGFGHTKQNKSNCPIAGQFFDNDIIPNWNTRTPEVSKQHPTRMTDLVPLDEKAVKEFLNEPFYEKQNGGSTTRMWLIAQDRDLIAEHICARFSSRRAEIDGFKLDKLIEDSKYFVDGKSFSLAGEIQEAYNSGRLDKERT